MRMFRTGLFLLTAAVGLFAPTGAHAICYQTHWGTGNVCGTVNQLGFNGYTSYAKTANPSYVKICPAGAASSDFRCSTVQTETLYDTYHRPYQSFIFRNLRQSSTTSEAFDFYAWDNYADPWGSETRPIKRFTLTGGLEGIVLNQPPRPLSPAPVYPKGSDVPNAYLVTWESGVNLDRTAYPITYEILFKYWPFGGTEPASWTPAANNLNCHDDGSGPDAYNECSTYVAGPQPPGNWKWYVVANLDVSGAVPYYYPNTIFTTESGRASFTQPY
jgi:hypothetical protein